MERVTKHIVVGLFSLLISSTAFAAKALNDIDAWGIKPNVGLDAGVKNQSFSDGFGNELFRENYPETNLYFGMKFHPLVGMEIGYEHMYRQQKTQYVPEGVAALGFFDPVIATINRGFISDVYSQGWNFNLLGFWPICPRTKTELMGSIGLAWQKMYYSTIVIGDGLILTPSTPLAMWESDHRAMLRLGIGIRQMITKHFGARFLLDWEDTSKLSGSFPVPVGQGGLGFPTLVTDNYTVKPKDNYSVLLGFFFQTT